MVGDQKYCELRAALWRGDLRDPFFGCLVDAVFHRYQLGQTLHRTEGV